jgi:hypothetical protein
MLRFQLCASDKEADWRPTPTGVARGSSPYSRMALRKAGRAAAPAGAEQEAFAIVANAGGLDIDVRFVQHEDGGLGGEHAALLDIAQIDQGGLDPVHRLLFLHRADTRIHHSEPGEGAFQMQFPEKARDDLLRINDVGRMSCPIENGEFAEADGLEEQSGVLAGIVRSVADAELTARAGGFLSNEHVPARAGGACNRVRGFTMSRTRGQGA